MKDRLFSVAKAAIGNSRFQIQQSGGNLYIRLDGVDVGTVNANKAGCSSAILTGCEKILNLGEENNAPAFASKQAMEARDALIRVQTVDISNLRNTIRKIDEELYGENIDFNTDRALTIRTMKNFKSDGHPTITALLNQNLELRNLAAVNLLRIKDLEDQVNNSVTSFAKLA